MQSFNGVRKGAGKSLLRELVRSSESGIPSSWNCEDWDQDQAV